MATETGYYVIIPSRVRYDKYLSMSSKMLYGEILALSEKTGYCFATNGYFADLYGVTTVTVSSWVGELINRNYIYSEGDPWHRRLYVTNRAVLDNETINEVKEPEKVTEPDSITEIVDYLNSVCHTKFRKNTAATKRVIRARLREGFSLQDFKDVIEWKYNQWGKNPFKFSNGQMSSDYLRPTTLFGNKFETYLYESHNNMVCDSEAIVSVPPDEERADWAFE